MIALPDTPTISIEEAAGILGVSPRTAYRMAESGDLPTINLGARRSRRVPTALFLTTFKLLPAS